VSPATECRDLGYSFVVGSLVLLAAGLAHDGVFRALFTFVWMAVFFGALMYRLQYRALIRRAAEEAEAPPSDRREPRGATIRRAATAAVAQLVVLGLISLAWQVIPFFDGAPMWSLAGGILAGLGMMNLLSSRWLTRWERQHDCELLKAGMTTRQIVRFKPARDAWRLRPPTGLTFYGVPRVAHGVVFSGV
jgi:hypothetical protein